MKLLETLLPTCRQVSRLQSDLLDQPLSLPRRFGLRLHLLVCKWCRRYGKQIRFLHEAAHEHADELAKEAAEEAYKETYNEAYKDAYNDAYEEAFKEALEEA